MCCLCRQTGVRWFAPPAARARPLTLLQRGQPNSRAHSRCTHFPTSRTRTYTYVQPPCMQTHTHLCKMLICPFLMRHGSILLVSFQIRTSQHLAFKMCVPRHLCVHACAVSGRHCSAQHNTQRAAHRHVLTDEAADAQRACAVRAASGGHGLEGRAAAACHTRRAGRAHRKLQRQLCRGAARWTASCPGVITCVFVPECVHACKGACLQKRSCSCVFCRCPCLACGMWCARTASEPFLG